MARSVMSRLSPPRSLMSSAERPVPMPRTSASRLTSTSTSTTTSSKSTTTNSTSTPMSTTTSTSPRSSLTSPSLVFSSQSRSSPKGRSGTEEERSKRTLSEATRMNSIPPFCLHSTKKKHVTSSTRVVRIIFSHSICFRNCNVSLLFLCIIILAGK